MTLKARPLLVGRAVRAGGVRLFIAGVVLLAGGGRADAQCGGCTGYTGIIGTTTKVSFSSFICPSGTDQVNTQFPGPLPEGVAITPSPNPISAPPSVPIPEQFLYINVPNAAAPGTFQVTRTETSETGLCGWGGPYQDTLTLQYPTPTISGTTTSLFMSVVPELWWFGGNTVSGYQSSVMLTANNAFSGPYTWTITAPDGDLVFQDTASTSETTSGNTVTVVTSGETNGSNPVAPQVTVTANGQTSGPWVVVVTAPHSFVADTNVGSNGIVDGPWPYGDMAGFQSQIWYLIYDQFGELLPNVEIPLNEQFTSDFISNYSGGTENWPSTTASGAQEYPTGWADGIGVHAASYYTPPVLTPPASGGVGPTIDYRTGGWFVGSETIGVGLPVQTNTWQRYQDHGRHLSIVSPVAQ